MAMAVVVCRHPLTCTVLFSFHRLNKGNLWERQIQKFPRDVEIGHFGRLGVIIRDGDHDFLVVPNDVSHLPTLSDVRDMATASSSNAGDSACFQVSVVRFDKGAAADALVFLEMMHGGTSFKKKGYAHGRMLEKMAAVREDGGGNIELKKSRSGKTTHRERERERKRERDPVC